MRSSRITRLIYEEPKILPDKISFFDPWGRCNLLYPPRNFALDCECTLHSCIPKYALPDISFHFIFNSLYMVAPQVIGSVLQGAMLKIYHTMLQNKANNYNKKLVITNK